MNTEERRKARMAWFEKMMETYSCEHELSFDDGEIYQDIRNLILFAVPTTDSAAPPPLGEEERREMLNYFDLLYLRDEETQRRAAFPDYGDSSIALKIRSLILAPPQPAKVSEHQMAELITDLTYEESEITQWSILERWLHELGIAVEPDGEKP